MTRKQIKKQNKNKVLTKKKKGTSLTDAALKTNRKEEQTSLKSAVLSDSDPSITLQPNDSAEKKATLSDTTSAVAAAIAQAPKKLHKKMNIPNMLTLFRIWAIPAIVFTFFFDTPMAAWVGVALFLLAAVSDYMDGYLARHLNQLSRFGRVLDPIADKLLIGSILLMLAFTARLGDYGIIPAVIILCREILVSGLREFLAEIKVGCPVTRLAKWKTACQMTALPMLMVCEPAFSGFLSEVFYYVGHLALWGAALLTVMTGYDYWKSGRKYMDE